MDTFNFMDEKTVKELKDDLKTKNEHLTRDQINDLAFVQMLDKLDIEGRVRMMYACMFNDTFTRIRYRKTKY